MHARFEKYNFEGVLNFLDQNLKAQTLSKLGPLGANILARVTFAT